MPIAPQPPPMQYRRFGKTEESISVFTLGGMRFEKGWDEPRDQLPKESIDNCIETLKKSFETGINHIETAHGYVKSEALFGKAIKELSPSRDSFKMMTKGAPMTRDETLKLVEEQLETLGLEKVEFYAWHGINNKERLDQALKTGGPVETLLDLKEKGLIGHVGFSTHAPVEIIEDAIRSDLFSFVNLHYYYFFQRNLNALRLAGEKDLGVLIISPNDKGGQLWNPSSFVKEKISPLTAIQFNGQFCLSHPEVSTLSLGMHEEMHFSQNLKILEPITKKELINAKEKMDAPLINEPDACTLCHECLPCPETINIPEVLRFRNMWKAYGMEDFGFYRYNMLEEKDHWFPGSFADRCTECGDCLDRCPESLQIPKLLIETHQKFYKQKPFSFAKILNVFKKRLFSLTSIFNRN